MSRMNALVDGDWVAKYLNDPAVVLVEVDKDSTYCIHHLPGAFALDWRADLQHPNGAVSTERGAQ